MDNSLKVYWESYENAKDIDWKPDLDGWDPHSEILPSSRDPCTGHGGDWQTQVERVVEAILVLLILVLLAIIYYWKRCKRNSQVRN